MQASPFVLCSLVVATTALAQITPDNTLGNESSVVTPNVNVNGNLADLIEGGAIRESNLFHSFSDFNVAEMGRVYFGLPAGIENILSRVTGTNVSNIFGTLGVLGNANLFLINPNGIVFGSNSRLDVGGSFFGSTADSVLFDDGTVFSALNPNEKPLLTINIPSGLQYGSNPGSITNQSSGASGLQVPNGQTLGLIGGDITIDGGNLTATDGRIELGSVGNGVVNLTPTDTSFMLDYSAVNNFQDISLSEGAIVNTSGEGGGSIQVQGANVSLRDRSSVFADTEGSGSGGGIEVRASQLTLEGGSAITTDVTGSGVGGNLTVDATESVRVSGVSPDGTISALGARVFQGATGNGGDVSITTGELMVSDGAFVSAGTFGLGDGGNLTVDADSTVQLIGTDASGQFPSGLFTTTFGTGNGGELNITTGELIVSDGAQVAAGTVGEGNSGNLTVDADSTVQLIGTDASGQFPSRLSTNTQGTGNGGELNIITGELMVSDGAFVSASTFGEGHGGSLTVDAEDTVQVIGQSADGRSGSGMFVQANEGSKGNGGDLSITTGQLIVSDGAQVSVSTFGEGDGGNLTVDASESVQLIGRTPDGKFASGLFIGVNREATGNAGKLLKITTGQLIVKDGARVSARSIEQDSSAGTVEINANSIFLDNKGIITAETAGNQGNIKLEARHIQLLNESNITTKAQNTDGGNIFIDTDTLVGLGNSDITADADEGSGGRVEINAKGIFGLEFRDRETPDNDITSTSTLGSSFNGDVILNISQVDPTSGLTELPASPVDAEAILANDLCGFENNRIAGGSSFIITGKGGLPPTPENPVINAHRTVGWRRSPRLANTRQPLPQQAKAFGHATRTVIQPQPPQEKKVIIEAQGWVTAKDGTIILTAQPFRGTPVDQILPNLDCHSGRGSREQGAGSREE
ncbi:filamentous hemagglutinin N-terminal domain-containing protein [Moorena producens]|uniref:two-partner secretion domain-containing protein n=1 Tax=Moorena producens TaxID=1155739 RepID=UPI003C722A90